MVKGRRLKKVGGDLEAQKQNVISSELIIWEQNVVPLEPRVDESSNPCGLELAMIFAIQMMKSLPTHIGNFDQKMLGQIISESTYIDQMQKKIIKKILNLIIPAPFII